MIRRRVGGVAERTGPENRRACGLRGFESHTLLALLLLAAPAAAQDPGRSWHVEAFAGAGFAGIRVIDVDERPVWVQDAAGEWSRNENRSAYVPRESWEWRPALSTGLMAGLWPDDGVGVGAGAHMIFLPVGAEATKPYPAITLHVGRLDRHMYIGAAWTPRDEFAFPGDQPDAVLPRGLSTDDFVVRRAGSGVSFYLGFIVVSGGLDAH